MAISILRETGPEIGNDIDIDVNRKWWPSDHVVVGRVLRLRRNTHWQQYASFDSLLSRAGLGHLGKVWIVRGTTTGRWPYWANGLFYPSQILDDICHRHLRVDVSVRARTSRD